MPLPANISPRTLALIVVLLLVLAIPLVLSLTKTPQDIRQRASQDPNQVVRVDKDTITTTEIQLKATEVLGQRAGNALTKPKTKEHIINSLIEESLIAQEAARFGITVKTQDLTSQKAKAMESAGTSVDAAAVKQRIIKNLTVKELTQRALKEQVEKKVVTWRIIATASVFKGKHDPDYQQDTKRAINSLNLIREKMLQGKSMFEAYNEARRSANFDQKIRLQSNVYVEKGDDWGEFITPLFAAKTGAITQVLQSEGGSLLLAKILDSNDTKYASFSEWLTKQKAQKVKKL